VYVSSDDVRAVAEDSRTWRLPLIRLQTIRSSYIPQQEAIEHAEQMVVAVAAVAVVEVVVVVVIVVVVVVVIDVSNLASLASKSALEASRFDISAVLLSITACVFVRGLCVIV
jgi:hypothetical protein